MRYASCHTDRKHFAKGLCEKCYAKVLRDASSSEKKQKKAEYAKKWRIENLSHVQEMYLKRRERVLLDAEYKERDKLSRRNWQYRNKYGISFLDALDILEDQGGCAVCGKLLTADTMCVDHCHSTGVVRGVLCSGCNTGLGLLGDTRESLMKAVSYLSNSIAKTNLLAQSGPAKL